MSLIGNIDNIPLFTTIAEAELWGSQYGITGHHTHVLLGQLGYMAGTTHADITSANLNVVSNVSSLVDFALITSTSFITGTGFMKCIPITLSGRFVTDAILVIDIEEVLDAKMTFSPQSSSN